MIRTKKPNQDSNTEQVSYLFQIYTSVFSLENNSILIIAFLILKLTDDFKL